MIVSAIFYSFALFIFLFFTWFSFISYKEKEPIALKKSLMVAFLLPIPFIVFTFFPEQYHIHILFVLIAFVFASLILLAIPFKKVISDSEESNFRIDERDTMFSRLEITHQAEKLNTYYHAHPELEEIDSEWREKPGLMSPASTMYHPLAFAAADASFGVIGELRQHVYPTPSGNKKNIDINEITTFIKTWSKKLGAVDIGICKLKPYHFYSHRGRGEAYNKEVDNRHLYGIAITVEMNKDYLASGPAAPTLMESAQQYLNSGAIALQLTYFIANLGYSAKAHIDGNYEVVCPLVARDAGIGEIGRMGLLMTPKLGPRVRIAVVTTDIPLLEDKRNIDLSVNDFCRICKKCADVCPSQAIPKDQKKEINGVRRWQINQEKCFSYWCTSGTDCGRCMSICPYSHPNNTLHNLVRWSIKKSWLFRRIALWMDDFFYGRKPKVKKFPKGIQ